MLVQANFYGIMVGCT